MATDDGDIQGGDLPGWLPELLGGALIASLADRRGECIHAACPHWRRCFIEHTIRRSRTAELVVANHALVMTQAAWGGLDDNAVPTRYVFDEGHHVFDAADSAFSAALSGGKPPNSAAGCAAPRAEGPAPAACASGWKTSSPTVPARSAAGRRVTSRQPCRRPTGPAACTKKALNSMPSNPRVPIRPKASCA